jgi:hypothetical protein
MRKTHITARIGTELELTQLELVQGGLINGCNPVTRAKMVFQEVDQMLNEIRNLPSTIWNTITSWF